MGSYAFINDRFVAEEEAVLPVRDLAFLRGYGVFDFFRLRGQEPLFLDEHLRRFYFSAQTMHLPLPLTDAELRSVIAELVKKNQLPDTGIRLTLTGGISPDGYLPGTPNLVITQHGFSEPTEEMIMKGITLCTYPYQRQLPVVKSIDYLMAVWLQPWLKEQGADDVLYHDKGAFTECPRSNFFIVTQDHVLVTPAAGMLPGITRSKVLALAAPMMRVEERPILREDLLTAREAFITSTTKRLLPVRKIDDTIFEIDPGSYTFRLLKIYDEFVE